jgi:hypothetical protein
MGGTDTFHGAGFQAAYSVSLAFDVLAGEGELLQVEGDYDVVDAALSGIDDVVLRSVQAKTKQEPYTWKPGEIAKMIKGWLAGSPADGEHFDFVTNGSLGKSLSETLAPALRRVAEGTASEADRESLADAGLDPDDSSLRRVSLHSRLPSGRDLLEQQTLRLIALREQSEPLTVDEARDTIMALFGELVLGSGEAEREKRRLSRAEIAEMVGVDLKRVDAAETWSGRLEARYREALAARKDDPIWTVLDLAEAEPPPALSVVTSNEKSKPIPATQLLEFHDSILIQGPAGAGKTTTISQLARAAAESGQLPIRLDLASYRAGAIGHLIHGALERVLEAPLAPGTARLLLSRPSTIVLVDGAGELIAEQRESLVADVQGLRQLEPDGARLLLAARHGFALTPLALAGFSLQALDADRRREIAAAFGDEAEAGRIEGKLGSVVDNPLLFTMALALSKRGLGAATRVELFDRFVEGLQGRPEGRAISALALEAVEMACLDLRRSGRYSAEEWWWLDELTKSRDGQIARGTLGEDSPAATQILDELLESGLLRRLGGGSELGLLHDLFCDWLAAEAIRKGHGNLPEPLPETLEEAVTFLAERGELDAEACLGLTANPVAAARAADFLPAEEIDIERVAELWRGLAGSLGPEVAGLYRDAVVSVDEGGHFFRILGEEGEAIACLAREPVSALSAAVDLYLAAIRVGFEDPPRHRPVVPSADQEELAAQLTEASKERLETMENLLATLVPGFADRIMQQLGPQAIRGWLMPAEEFPGMPGTDLSFRSHRLPYVLVDEDPSVVAVGSEDEIPIGEERMSAMAAETYVSESPADAAAKQMRKALGQLIPRYDA